MTTDKTVIKTMCAGCIWETVDNGCSIGILGKYVKQNAEIIIEDGHTVINKRGCLYRRTPLWRSNLSTITKDTDELYQIARKEIRIDTTLLLLLEDEGPEELKQTLTNIQSMELAPTFIIILSKGNMSVSSLISFFQTYQCQIPYRFERMVGSLSERKIIDIGSKKTKTRWVMVMKVGHRPSPSLLKDIDVMLNDDLRQIVLIKREDDINEMFFLRILAKQIGYNREDLLENKVERICQAQNVPHLIIK